MCMKLALFMRIIQEHFIAEFQILVIFFCADILFFWELSKFPTVLLHQALSERLFYYIAVSLLPHNTLCELEAAVEAGRALSPILQWHKHPNDYFSREAQTLYFNSLRTYWQELIDLTRWGQRRTPGDTSQYVHQLLKWPFKSLTQKKTYQTISSPVSCRNTSNWSSWLLSPSVLCINIPTSTLACLLVVVYSTVVGLWPPAPSISAAYIMLRFCFQPRRSSRHPWSVAERF